MNRTEEITSRLAVIKKSLQATNLFTLALRVEDVEKLIKDLPDFQRIDEERFKKICIDDIKGSVEDAVKEYNSTLPPALVPLPKEMPKDLVKYAMGHDVYEVWDKIISEYGTPEAKPSLPTVEELAKEIAGISVPIVADKKLSRVTAEYIIDKYSLPTREWWQELKEGDKFMYGNLVREFDSFGLMPKIGGWMSISKCTPYTPPTADDIIAKHNLSEEEIRAIREGKCT